MDHQPPAKPSDPSSADTAQESPTFIEDDAMTPLPPYVTTARPIMPTLTSIELSADLVEQARLEAAVFNRSIEEQIEHWVRLGQAAEETPGYTLDRVHAALEGRFNPDDLSEGEFAIYEDLEWQASLVPTPEALAFAEAIKTQPGAVGYDEQDRYVRVRPDGSREVIG